MWFSYASLRNVSMRAEHLLRFGLDSLALSFSLSFQHTHTNTCTPLPQWCDVIQSHRQFIFPFILLLQCYGVLWGPHDLSITTILVTALAMFITTVTSVCWLHYSHHYNKLFHLYHTTIILCVSVNHQPEEKTVMIWHTYTKQQACT